jgi:ABC-type multidrug transport system fused ATPase/permease subunit
MKLHRLLVADLMQRLGWRFPGLIVLTALLGISEGASIVLLLPLLNRVGIVSAPTQGLANEVIDKGLTLVGANSTGAIFLVVVIVATAQMFFTILLNWWSVRLARSYQSQRQLELFGAFMRAKWAFIVDRKAGEMTNAIITECERLGRAFTLSLSLLGSAVIIVIYVALSLVIAWQVTLSLVGFAVIAALIVSRFYQKSYASGKSLAPLNSQLQSSLEEQLAAAKFIKASASADRVITQIQPVVQRLEDVNVSATAMPGTVRAVLEYVALIGLAAILVMTSAGFGVAPANVIITLALFGRLFPRLTTVQAQLHALNTHVHALEAVNSLQTTAEADAERRDSPGAEQELHVDLPTNLAVHKLEVKLGERKALDGVDLRLRIPGLVAVVGGSGAGKSTLVHTLLGLTEPSTGAICLGNYDFASASLTAWRRAIGYVPQETILFHASIRDNLIFANPAASESEVEIAARRAHAHEFIMTLPDGYETIIGDQGVKLSGGQRQRLGIARALLVNPLLLILDEAMSALDAISEIEILRTLEELRNEIGILIIAHRLTTVGSADTIYVLEAGQVAENGTWDELMARRGRLYALAKSQGLDRVAENAS